MKRSLALGLPLACPKNHSSIQHIGGKSMKRLLLWAGLIAFLLVSSAFGETLTVLHLNDTHAHLLPYGPKDASGNAMWGGMARVATLVGMNRATEPNVMLLNAGDISVGDFMFQKYLSIPELEIMKALGYDALTLGNHEFDLYSSTLKYELNAAGFPASGFPVLCANLDMTADPEMGYFVQPYTIKQYGAVRVGIFGLTTDATNSQSNPQPLSVIPPLDVAQKWIDSLKIGHGCNVVILLSHLGIDMDEAVASYTSGIDVIVGGHSHTKIDQPIKIGNTIVVQAGEFAHYLGKLHLFVNGGSVTGYNYQLMPVDQNVPAEPTISGMLPTHALVRCFRLRLRERRSILTQNSATVWSRTIRWATWCRMLFAGRPVLTWLSSRKGLSVRISGRERW
jgi:5'-nucleotidase / UDP-sugar diphosphatase